MKAPTHDELAALIAAAALEWPPGPATAEAAGLSLAALARLRAAASAAMLHPGDRWPPVLVRATSAGRKRVLVEPAAEGARIGAATALLVPIDRPCAVETDIPAGVDARGLTIWRIGIEWELIDLCVVSLAVPGRWKTAFGVAELAAEIPPYAPPVRLHATPLDWLEAGREGSCILDWSRDPRVLIGSGKVACDETVERALLRRIAECDEAARAAWRRGAVVPAAEPARRAA